MSWEVGWLFYVCSYVDVTCLLHVDLIIEPPRYLNVDNTECVYLFSNSLQFDNVRRTQGGVGSSTPRSSSMTN